MQAPNARTKSMRKYAWLLSVWFAATVLGAGVGLLPGVAEGRPSRPRFEPTDLGLQEPGTAQLDVQIGSTYGEGDQGNRVMLPDVELNVGLLPNLELDLDASFFFTNVTHATRQFIGDALWTSVKIGLVDVAGPTKVWALGVQLGPRFPTVGNFRGLGYEALLLWGVQASPVRLILNGGGLIDPGDGVSYGRPVSILTGAYLDWTLDHREAWSLRGGAAGVFYVSSDPHKLDGTLGIAWSMTKHLEVSATVLGGVLPGNDRAAIFLGCAPSIDLW